MADAEKDLKIVITSDSSQAKSDLAGLSKDFNDTGRRLTEVMLGLGVGVAAGLGLAIKNAVGFEYQMSLLQTQAGASAAEVKKMSQAVLELSGSVGIGPEELAKGLYHVESAGLRGTQALDLLKTAAQGAKVGHADLETVTNALVATFYSGIGGVKSMDEAMGVLNATVGAGNMRMQDLTDSLSSGILPTAKVFGLTMQDVGAALATMTDSGVPAIEASTRLRMSFSLLAAPTKQASKELQSIGIAHLQLAEDMRKGGLTQALDDLKQHLESSGRSASEQADILAKAFGGGRSSSTILLLLDQLDRVKSKYSDISAATDKFADAWDQAQRTAQFQTEKLNANMQRLSISFGNLLLPAVNSFLDTLNTKGIPALQDFGNWVSKNAKMLEILGGIIATVVLPPLLLYWSTMVTKAIVSLIQFYVEGYKMIGMLLLKAAQLAITTIAIIAHAAATAAVTVATGIWTAAQWLLNAALAMNPIGLVVIAIAALVGIIVYAYTHSETFRNIVNKLWETLKVVGSWVQTTLVSMFNSFLGVLNNIVGAINIAIGAVEKFMGMKGGGPSLDLQHRAMGGSASGLTLVGEQGPELVSLPGGSYVHSNSDSQKMTGGTTVNIYNPSVRSDQDITEIVRQVKQSLGRENELFRMGVQ